MSNLSLPLSPVPMIVGPWGPTQLACLRSWRARGWPVVFVQTEGPRQPWGLRPLVAAHAFKPLDELKTTAGVRWLAEFVRRHRVTGLTCVADELALWLQRELVLPPGAQFWLAPPAAIECLSSKAAQVELAREAGFPILPTWYVRSAREVREIPDAAFPLVARPDTTPSVRPLFKAQYVDSRESLADFVASRTSIERPLVLQPFRRGPNLLVHGWRRADGSDERYAFFEVPRKLDGVAVSIVARAPDASLEQSCRRFAASLGLRGVFHFDLLQDAASGQVHFLEANGRLGGTTGKVLALGWDEPAALPYAHGVPGSEPPPEDPRPGALGYNVQAALKFLLRSTRGALTTLDHPDAGSFEAARALLKMLAVGRDEVGMWRAPRWAFAFYAQRLQRHA